MPACWEWKSGHGATSWTAFSDDVRAKLDAAVLAGVAEVDVDAERYVDIEQMRQLRRDDPSKSRAVRTGPEPTSSAVGPTSRLSRAARMTRNCLAEPFEVSRKLSVVSGKRGIETYLCPFVIDQPATVSWSFEVEKDDIDFR